MRKVFLFAGLFLLVGCPNVPEPKQRDDWSLPPTRYGTVDFHGLASPDRMAHDAGVAQDEDAEAP